MIRSATAAFILALIGFAGPATAASPSGMWKSTATFNNQPAEGIFKLKVDSEGSVLHGHYLDGYDEKVIPIMPVQVTDHRIGIVVVRELNGQKLKVTFSGTLSGNTITGQSQWEIGGQVQTSDWVARRLR